MERFDELAAAYGIPDALRGMVSPEAPARGKMAIANGVFPAPPAVLLALMYLLVGDPDPKVSDAATRGLSAMPPRMLVENIGANTHPRLLEFIAWHVRDPAVQERIALQRQVSDRTLCYLAEIASDRVVEIIAANQERLITAPTLYLHLKLNPVAPRWVLDKVVTFQRMVGIDVTGLELQPAAARPAAPVVAAAPTAPPLAAVDADDPLADLFAELGLTGAAESPPAPPAGGVQGGISRASAGVVESPDEAAEEDPDGAPDQGVGALDLEHLQPLAATTFGFAYEDGADPFDSDLTDDHESTSDDLVAAIHSKVSKLSVGKKIKLAYVGNKEVRELLVRDRNKMVASAVVKSGRMTDPEVARVASNRSIAAEVLRLIASDREWVRVYPVKVALANNPKTPVSVAVSFIAHLQVKDLKNLANNRNVSSVVFGSAQRLLREKKQT